MVNNIFQCTTIWSNTATQYIEMHSSSPLIDTYRGQHIGNQVIASSCLKN